MIMKHYKVTVMKAHLGRGRNQYITFFIRAESALKASEIAKNFPGVKHSKPVMCCVPITLAEYVEGRKISAYKNYQ